MSVLDKVRGDMAQSDVYRATAQAFRGEVIKRRWARHEQGKANARIDDLP